MEGQRGQSIQHIFMAILTLCFSLMLMLDMLLVLLVQYTKQSMEGSPGLALIKIIGYDSVLCFLQVNK